MNSLSIRITHREGDVERSIDIDTYPSTPAVLTLTKASGCSEPKSRYTDNGDGTVTDSKTGLMWSKDDATDKAMSWKKGEEACKALRLGGFSDWRYPSREELLTLVDDTRHNPAIDTDAFPLCKSEWYWTATPYAPSRSVYAWGVYFGYGGSYGVNRDYDSRVRAVRVASGQ